MMESIAKIVSGKNPVVTNPFIFDAYAVLVALLISRVFMTVDHPD